MVLHMVLIVKLVQKKMANHWFTGCGRGTVQVQYTTGSTRVLCTSASTVRGALDGGARRERQ